MRSSTNDGERRSRKRWERRSGIERRQVYHLNYFENGGLERRQPIIDRRIQKGDRRRISIRATPMGQRMQLPT